MTRKHNNTYTLIKHINKKQLYGCCCSVSKTNQVHGAESLRK